MRIEKAAELLREQLEKLLQGSDSFDQIGRTIKSAKADVIKKYSGVFAPEHIPELSAEEFRSFLLFKNNQHWDSLQRQGPQMTADIVKLRRALATLVMRGVNVSSRNQTQPSGISCRISKPGETPVFVF